MAEIDKTEQISICEKLDKLYGIIKSRERELQLLNDLIKARFVELFGNPVSNPKGWERVTVDECVDSIDNGKVSTYHDGTKVTLKNYLMKKLTLILI